MKPRGNGQQNRQRPPTVPPQGNRHNCQLEVNRFTVNGMGVDYQIILMEPTHEISDVIAKTEDLFEVICLFYLENRWKARIIAECEYERMNDEGEVIGRETYHHASYQSEWCSLWQAEEFYKRHFEKIGARMEVFLRNGSSLRFSKFKHIHIAVSVAG